MDKSNEEEMIIPGKTITYKTMTRRILDRELLIFNGVHPDIVDKSYRETQTDKELRIYNRKDKIL